MRETGNTGLVTANALIFQTLSNSTAGFFRDAMVVNVINTQVGHVAFTASVTGTASVEAYLRPEVWHMGGEGDIWYHHSTLAVTTVDAGNGTKDVSTMYYIDKFAPYIRLQIAVGTANGVSHPSGGNASATIRSYFVHRGDV